MVGAACATTIPGGDIINQTWTPAGSPCVVAEPTESFLVNLSNPDNVTLGTTSARVLIFDYDDLLCLIFRNGYE